MGKQFLITHPSVDKNEFGYVLPESSVREWAVRYIIDSSSIFFLKPWFIYLVSLALFVYGVVARLIGLEMVTLGMSGFLYFMSLVGFGNAADARLPFYTNVIAIISIFIIISRILKKKELLFYSKNK